MLHRVTKLITAFALLFLISACSQGPTEIKGVTHIDNDELTTLLDKGVVLVDIRRREEWRQTGIIKGSKMITLFNAQGKIENGFVPRFQSVAKPGDAVAIICRTGNRTLAASQILTEQLGYTDIYNVTKGITQWIKEKRPVVGG